MASSDIEIVRAAFEAFAGGDVEAVLELCDPEIVIRDPERTGVTSHGVDGLRRFWEEWFENWQEYRVEPTAFEEHGDEILVSAEQIGRGALSGVEVHDELFNVFRLRSGKVVEYRIYGGREAALESMHAGE
jgi:ketosteroid isomerase-like protein